MPNQWINQVRQLLARASSQQRAALVDLNRLKSCLDPVTDAEKSLGVSGFGDEGYAVKRKHLLAQITLKSRYYGMSEEVQAIVYATGCQVLQELDNDQLHQLLDWVLQQIDRADNACDPDAGPPAR